VVHALHNIRNALVPGGLLVDTQPISPQPPVTAGNVELGTLDMSGWAEIIAATDQRVASTIDDGLWRHEHERTFVVSDTFENGAELLDTVKDWKGTRLTKELKRRLNATAGSVRVHQLVRLRLLRAIQ
jgi:hypothetical protein